MKYIVEVLNPRRLNGTGTEIYSNKEAAIAALDSYAYHRTGQPVIALYNGEEDIEALIAIGTSTSSYYIIGESKEITNNFFTKINASNVILDEIDITDLLSNTGPGYDKQDGDAYDLDNCDRHFGWLGTTESQWAVSQKDGGHYTNDGISVQDLFDAILYGRRIQREGIRPDIDILLKKKSDPESEWTHNLTLVYESDNDSPQTINIKLIVKNFSALSGTETIYAVSPNSPGNIGELISQGNGIYIYDEEVTLFGGVKEYKFRGENENGYDTSIAKLQWVVNNIEPEEEPTDNVYTNEAVQKANSLSVNLYGSSNFDYIQGTQYIRYRKYGEDEWILVQANDYQSRHFNTHIDDLEAGVKYEYQAYASNDDGIVYGGIKTFTLLEISEIKYRFSWQIIGDSREAEDATTVSGFINNVSVTSGESHSPFNEETGDPTTWRIEALINEDKRDKYVIDSIITTNYSVNPNSFEGELEGELFDNITVYIYVREKEEEPITYVKVNCIVRIKGDSNDYLDYTNYLQDYSHQYNFNTFFQQGTYNTFQVNVLPSINYRWLGWSYTRNEEPTSSENYTTIKVDNNMTLYAWIERVDSYTVSIGVAGGVDGGGFVSINDADNIDKINVSQSISLNEPSNVVLRAKAKDGYSINRWTKNGNDYTPTESQSQSIYDDQANANFLVYFKNDETVQSFNIKIKASTGGKVLNNSSGDILNEFSYNQNDGTTFIGNYAAIKDSNYAFIRWDKNGTLETSNENLNLNFTVNQDVTYEAIFSLIQHKVTFKLDEISIQIPVQFSDYSTSIEKYISHGYSIGNNIPKLRPSDLEEYAIEYWYTLDDPNTHYTNSQLAAISVIEDDIVYFARVNKKPEEPKPQWKNYTEGESSWRNAYISIDTLKTNAQFYSDGVLRQDVWNKNDTAQFSDLIMDSNIKYYIPYQKSDMIDADIRIKIPEGYTFTIYEYSTRFGRWIETNNYFTEVSGEENVYEYILSEDIKTIYGIKLS